MEAELRPPANGAEPGLPGPTSGQPPPDEPMQGGLKPVGVRTFHEDPADLRIPGLGEGSAVLGRATRVFGGHQPQKAHELPGMGKLGEVPALGHQCGRRQPRHAAQGLQRLEERPQRVVGPRRLIFRVNRCTRALASSNWDRHSVHTGWRASGAG